MQKTWILVNLLGFEQFTLVAWLFSFLGFEQQLGKRSVSAGVGNTIAQRIPAALARIRSEELCVL